MSPTQIAFNFPTSPHFSHIVVFMLPGNVLPDGTAAAVYMQLPGETSFRFLGAVANEKPSAIFKVNLPGNNNTNNNGNSNSGEGSIALGISVEPTSNIQAQLAQLKEQQQQQQQTTTTTMSNGSIPGSSSSSSSSSMALTLAKRQPTTKLLAQRIIQNAFNFLASFAGNLGPGGVEVVPLKSFEDWWKKFERRIENDPGFLERDG